MTAQALSNYMTQVAGKTDAYLGHLGWYTVSGVKIDHAQLIAALQSRGLSITVPNVPSEVDVFRRVSSIQVKKVPTAVEGMFENYLVRNTDERDPETIRRLIVCETVDKKGKRLSYQECYYVDFRRETSAITFGSIDPGYTNAQCQAICSEIVNEFQSWKGCLNSQSIREMIRHAMLRYGATKVRDGGGVYFMPEAQSTFMKSLEAFVNEDLSGASSFHSLPLVDDAKQRDMIQRAFEAETSDAIDSILAEIAELSANPKGISSTKYGRLLADYKELTSKTRSYTELLDTALGNADSRLAIFQQAVIGLRNKVKH